MLGVNLYTPDRVAAASTPPPAGETPFECTDQVLAVPQEGPYTDMGWRIETQVRTLKDSTVWYGRVMAANALVD